MKKSIIILVGLAMCIPAFGQRTKTMVNSTSNPPFQVSFIYPVTTNGWSAIQTQHSFSLHLLAGATGGTNGVEIAGFANYNAGNLKGVQASGFANYLTGNGQGVQASGFANFIAGSHQGVQASGFANATLGKFKGVQGTGFLNFADEFHGVQGSGFANITIGKTEGIQATGFLNASVKGFKGIQASGFANVSLGYTEGMQVSGFVNVAQNMKGMQFGMINVADTLDGIAVGFFSYSRNGYHKVEISSNETFQTNLAFRTGSNLFYNIFTAGIRWDKKDPNWAVGYGIGTRLINKPNWSIDMDLVSRVILPEDFEEEEWANLNTLSISTTRKFNSFEAFIGASINAFLYESENQNTGFIPWVGFEGKEQNTNYIVYPGFNIGVRI
jgi:hypothetical protein